VGVVARIAGGSALRSSPLVSADINSAISYQDAGRIIMRSGLGIFSRSGRHQATAAGCCCLPVAPSAASLL